MSVEQGSQTGYLDGATDIFSADFLPLVVVVSPGLECGPIFGFTALMTFATSAFRSHGFRILGLWLGRSKDSSSPGPTSRRATRCFTKQLCPNGTKKGFASRRNPFFP